MKETIIDNESFVKILTQLLIQQDFEDKEKGKDTYIKKTQVYRDLIAYFKNIS